ncbi:MAG: NADP-dependent isocitrate dehydrogenase [bacterium]
MNQKAKVPVTVAYGDGIGPEIMTAALHVLQEGGAALDVEMIEVGERLYNDGNTAGIDAGGWDSLRRTGLFFKAPITTPQGRGMKSLNVTIRKALGLYANVRPCVSYYPFVATKHPVMDLVIVRENEEGLYTGVEYRQSAEEVQCLKLMTRPAAEKIVRYAFEYARSHNRRKVSCFTKDNIMKMSDGLFHQVFDEIGAQYSDIEKEHLIVDIGAARLADAPEMFDVMVLPNLYGDILSDVAAQITGSVGLGGSANIGPRAAMFEAVHGSAPSLAGKLEANPSGLLLAGVMMLVHIGQNEAAERIHNAWLKTLEDGVHTVDIFKKNISRHKVGTKDFARAVVERLGQKPEKLKTVSYSCARPSLDLTQKTVIVRPSEKRELVGVDVFIVFSSKRPVELAEKLRQAQGDEAVLEMISNRGLTVWPQEPMEASYAETFCCRFKFSEKKKASLADIVELLGKLEKAGLEFVKTESLYCFDGAPGFSLGQGQ